MRPDVQGDTHLREWAAAVHWEEWSSRLSLTETIKTQWASRDPAFYSFQFLLRHDGLKLIYQSISRQFYMKFWIGVFNDPLSSVSFLPSFSKSTLLKRWRCKSAFSAGFYKGSSGRYHKLRPHPGIHRKQDPLKGTRWAWGVACVEEFHTKLFSMVLKGIWAWKYISISHNRFSRRLYLISAPKYEFIFLFKGSLFLLIIPHFKPCHAAWTFVSRCARIATLWLARSRFNFSMPRSPVVTSVGKCSASPKLSQIWNFWDA